MKIGLILDRTAQCLLCRWKLTIPFPKGGQMLDPSERNQLEAKLRQEAEKDMIEHLQSDIHDRLLLAREEVRSKDKAHKVWIHGADRNYARRGA